MATKLTKVTFPTGDYIQNTTYTLGTSGNTVTLTPSDGDAQSITVPYATSAGTATDSTKMPLAGGTFTGRVVYNNVSMPLAAGKVTGLTAGTTEIFKNAIAFSNPATPNDLGWIRVLGTGESDTVLEIATGDDAGGSTAETIAVRQYNTSSAITNEATLLDKSGNTTFPKNVTATKFIGALQGNADTATNVAWSGVTGKPSTYPPEAHGHGLLHSDFTTTVANTTEDSGWSMINSTYNGFLLKSIRFNRNAPSWGVGDYGAGICFGGNDTKGVMSVAYGSPSIKIAGGNQTKPQWWIGLTGTTGTTYNLSNFVTSDTKNTAGSTDTSSKIFLIGATSQAANPQTYSQDTAYVGTDGCLYSGGSKVLTSAPVTSVAGKTGAVTLTASDVGALAGNTNVNNVTQTATTDKFNMYEMLFSYTPDDNTTCSEGARKASSILVNPGSSILRVANINGGHSTVDLVADFNPYAYVWDSSSAIGLKVKADDIILDDGTVSGTTNNWDGTNTSLKTAVTDKLDKSGGTMTGTIITPANDSKGIRPATNNYGEIGDSSYWYNKTYSNDIYTTRTIVCASRSAASSVHKLIIASDDIYFADGDTRDTWDGTNSYLKTAISNKLDKSGGTMTGDIKWTPIAGQEKGLTWEESGYGDGFKIIPTFNGVNYDNRLCFKVSTGAAGAAYNYTNKAELWANGTFMCIDGHIGAKNNSITKNATQGNGGNTYRETDIAAWDSNNSPYCRIAAVCTEGGNCINHIQAINRTTSNSEFNNTLAVQATKAGTCTYSVTNAANFRTAIGAAASSSIKTKKDILDLTEEEALKLLQIRPVSFKYKDGFDIDGKYERNYGVIAEETLEIIPSVVNLPSVPEVEFDESKGLDQELTTVDYAKFVPYLIKLVQMQEKRIEELEKYQNNIL